MKLLLDEMYTGLKEYLESLKWEIVTVHEVGLQGVKDQKVIEHAKNNGLLLVTNDQKSADIAELVGAKYILVSQAKIAKIIDSEIRKKYSFYCVAGSLPKKRKRI